MYVYDYEGNIVGSINIETDEQLKAEEELRRIKDRLKGLAGVLITPTGLGGNHQHKIIEYERRCQQVAKELRELS